MDKKTAIITGGGSGIGFACLEKFYSHDYRIVVIDYHTEALGAKLEKAKISAGDIHIHQANVADFNELAEVFNVISDLKASVLINCAGISPATKPLHDYDVAEWKRCVDINLNGSFYASKLFAQQFLAHKLSSASVINISSIMGKRSSPGHAVYAATKHAVIGLTKSMAQDYATFNLRVNAIGPGVIETPMTSDWMQDDGFKNYFLSKIPMQRAGKAKEIANTAFFLCSDEASYLTGAYIPVDGGFLAV
ncbi:MAG: SDR family oxidoreductase [Gammaproteobacteria bacterium]